MKKLTPLLALFLLLPGAPPASAYPGEHSPPGSRKVWEDKMEQVVTSYLKIRTLLAGDQKEGLREEGLKIIRAVEGLRITHREAELRPLTQEIDLEAIARHSQMLNVPEMEIIRRHFEKISRQVVKYLHVFGTPEGLREPLQVFNCTMYPGYWAQENGEAGNPYYGKKMLQCGTAVPEEEVNTLWEDQGHPD